MEHEDEMRAYSVDDEVQTFADAANTFDTIKKIIVELEKVPHRVVCLLAVDNEDRISIYNSGPVDILLPALDYVATLAVETIDNSDLG